MYQWPRDNEQALIAYYGEPGPEVERQLVHVVPPFQMYYDDDKRGLIPLKSLLFHKKAADALLVALNRVWEKCGKSQATIDKLRISQTAGTYCKRKIAGSTRWSNHSFGGAIDIDSRHNGFNTGHGTQPTVLTEAFDSVGFRWGGRYHGRTDPMHYEACDDGTPHPAGLLDMPGPEASFDAWNGDGHIVREGFYLVPHDDFTETDDKDDGGENVDAPQAESGGGKGRGFFGRVRNWVVTAGTSLGFTGLGAITDWQIAIVMFAALFIFAAGTVAFVLWLFGKDAVRAWAVRELT